MRSAIPIVIVVVFSLFSSPSFAANGIFVVSGNSLLWSPPDAIDFNIVYESNPWFSSIGTSLKLDPRGAGKLYWINYESNRIYRSNVDGSDVQLFYFEAGSTGLANLSVDAQNGDLYWARRGDSENNIYGRISRASMESAYASNPEMVIGLAGESPRVTVDPTHGKIYYTRYPDWIYRAELDGTGKQMIVSVEDEPLVDLYGIMVDDAEGTIYWTSVNYNTGERWTLHRSDSNGVELGSLDPGPDQYIGFPSVDPQDGKIYWWQYNLVNENDFRIRRSNLDFSDVEDVAGPSSTLGYPVIDTRQPYCSRTTDFADITNLPGVDFGDISAVVDAFRNQPTVDPLLCDLYPCDLGGRRCMGDGIIDFRDISQSVDAFRNVYLNCPE